MNDKGVTTGEVQAHLAEISGVQVSRDTISTIIYVINVKIRDGTVANRPICAAIWGQLREHDVTHLNAGRRHLHPPRIRTRAGTDSGRQVVTILRGGDRCPNIAVKAEHAHELAERYGGSRRYRPGISA